ncbi:hypothetical protein AAEX28_15310 [Lentisphaerota bacterium WC36G]|nr:hypothetical protein LJT99_02080 [Lentisphaerae bacterium WC36]
MKKKKTSSKKDNNCKSKTNWNERRLKNIDNIDKKRIVREVFSTRVDKECIALLRKIKLTQEINHSIKKSYGELLEDAIRLLYENTFKNM